MFARQQREFGRLAPLSFSIIYGVGDRSLDLVCSNAQQLEMWVTGLELAVERVKAEESELAYIGTQWRLTATRPSQRLDLRELSALLKRLNIDMRPSVVAEKFHEFDVDGSGALNFEEFTMLLRDLLQRPEVHELMQLYGNGVEMTKAEFAHFLQHVQSEPPMPDQQVHAHRAAWARTAP